MPSQAQSDQTQVRFLHAVAGAGPASLLVEKGSPRLPSAFAKPSGYQVFRPGQTRLRLILNGQSSPVATEVVRLGPGKHTVVAVGTDKGVDLLVYQDDGVQPGKATLRAIHVASEVGKADVRVDGKVVASDVGLGDATGYLPVPPGRHSVAVTRPGGQGGALVEAQVRSVAGTASSGFVVGSAGMPAQIVLTNDGTAGPVTAPATGLGGATSGGAWLLILGSSLIGGTLGGASYVLARRTRSRGTLQVATPALSAGPPAPSSVAAGPPLVADAPKEEETVVETPAVIEAPAVAAAPVAAARPMPPLPPMSPPPLDRGRVQRPNGHHPAEPEEAIVDAPAVPAPALWTPPPGERWAPAPAPTGRFARSEAEAAPVAPAGPSFVRPDDEATAPAPPSFPRFIRPDPEPEPDRVPAGEAVPAGDSDTPEPTTRRAHAAALRLHAGGRPRPRGPAAALAVARGSRPRALPAGAGSPARSDRARGRRALDGILDRRASDRRRAGPRAARDVRPRARAGARARVEEIVVEPTEVVEAPAPGRRRRGGRRRRRGGRRAGPRWSARAEAEAGEEPEPRSPCPWPRLPPCGPGAAPALGPPPAPPARTVRTR